MRGFWKSPIIVALAVTLACIVPMLTEAIEHVYWNERNRADPLPAPADIAVVSLDSSRSSGADRVIGSTARQAALLDMIAAAGPARVFFDQPLAEGADIAGDQAFARAAGRAAPILTMVHRASNDARNEVGAVIIGPSQVPQTVPAAVSAWNLNFAGMAQRSRDHVAVSGKAYPTVATAAVVGPAPPEFIVPDFRVRPDSVSVVNATDLLGGRTSPAGLYGKTVFVTTTDPSHGTALGYPGHGRQPAVMADVAGIVGMKQGPASDIGKLPLLLLAVAGVLIGRRTRGAAAKIVLYGGLCGGLLVLPALLLDARIVSGGSWAYVFLVAYAPLRAWERRKRRVELTNSSSGLPNIEGLASDGIPRGYDVLAASISQWEQMLATLPRELHGECARQVARRLSVASGDSRVYATDNGHFVWLEQPRPTEDQVSHLEGLKALFSAPLVIGGHLLDTNIHFGLDRLSENPPMRRIQAALASASEALSKGKLYEEFEQRRLAEAPWELSLHARIDEGLRNGDIWLALQPQLDLRTGRFFGAEALIRWSDPERGAIPPDAFILAAERAGRIEAITYWVLERAIEASKALNAMGEPFHIAVNLSARMADHPDLLSRVAELMIRHDFDASLLTFEVTETFSMTNREVARRNLHGLREMGFRLSIDDFGTGQASLAYLAEIPSDEIKLDKRFIQSITGNKRERVIVRTVIKLAHALGQEIVAEGVEDQPTLEALRRMNCDIVQGYHIGRPMRIEQLFEVLSGTTAEVPIAV